MSHTSSRRASAFVVLLVLALAITPALAAAETRAGSTVTVGPGETVDGLEVAAATVVVHGTVNGNLDGAAANVRISDSGVVTGDVNVAAASLRIDGEVGGDVSAGVATFVLGDGARVGGAVDVGAADATFAGQVEGDVTVGADTILVADSAALGGELRYDGDLTQRSGATVAGDVVQDESIGGNQFGFSPVPTGAGAVYGFLANLVLGAILLIAFPGTTRAIARTVADQPVRAGAFGLLTLFAVPLVLVVFALTIVGLPVTVLGAFLFALVVWTAVVYGWYAVASWALGRVDVGNDWVALAVGLLANAILEFVPVLGPVVSFAVFLAGLGALALVLDDYRRNRRNARRGTTADAPTA
ncbi:polymer-forming cytoskeletal protein [Halorubellus sp. JP-L1]|uniref:bactofilin family protein n=1 Tax=Halorubellus sp. JP-L1 TaxID=2715753 RepID=UPI001409E2A3|nr:polymer-forming cytoskeletal protein [Halorubellus sp. JP-L1]NHN43460.1 polymer-forming cytoskeletal protein [Halorubellus sp. JP-L1]